MSAMHPVEYLFVDMERVSSYLDQIGNRDRSERKRTWNFSMSLSGPRFDTKQETVSREKTSHEKIRSLIGDLDSRNLLQRHRPTSMGDSAKPFCLEVMDARKVILPAESIEAIPGLREFAVWVSDPLQDEVQNTDSNTHGTYLFLTESFWDLGVFHTVFSGCSALRAIVNTVKGKPFIDIGSDWIVTHPVDKLRELGGVALDSRKIESLYRTRYMTDEMFVGGGRGTSGRCNDLLGYPVFIAEPLGGDA